MSEPNSTGCLDDHNYCSDELHHADIKLESNETFIDQLLSFQNLSLRDHDYCIAFIPNTDFIQVKVEPELKKHSDNFQCVELMRKSGFCQEDSSTSGFEVMKPELGRNQSMSIGIKRKFDHIENVNVGIDGSSYFKEEAIKQEEIELSDVKDEDLSSFIENDEYCENYTTEFEGNDIKTFDFRILDSDSATEKLKLDQDSLDDIPIHQGGKFIAATEHDESVSLEPTYELRIYKCDHCGFWSKWRRSLNKHMKIEHDDNAEVYKCNECNYTSKRRDVFKLHVRCMHDDACELYKCTHCNFESKWKCSLTNHMKKSHVANVKVFGCSRCNYTSKRKNNMLKHLRCKHNRKDKRTNAEIVFL